LLLLSLTKPQVTKKLLLKPYWSKIGLAIIY
jgi:hypothetical protein